MDILNVEFSQELERIVTRAVQNAMQGYQAAPVEGPEIPCGIHEAAVIAGKKVSTLYLYHSTGKLPREVCVKHGRHLRFFKSALIAWIKQGNDEPQV